MTKNLASNLKRLATLSLLTSSIYLVGFTEAQTLGQILSGAGSVGKGMREAELEQARIEQLRLQNEILRREAQRLDQQRNQNSAAYQSNMVPAQLIKQQSTNQNGRLLCFYRAASGANFQLYFNGHCASVVQYNTNNGQAQYSYLDSTLLSQGRTNTTGTYNCVFKTQFGYQFQLPVKGLCPGSVWYDPGNNLVYAK